MVNECFLETDKIPKFERFCEIKMIAVLRHDGSLDYMGTL
jgi:hypothetical protein